MSSNGTFDINTINWHDFLSGFEGTGGVPARVFAAVDEGGMVASHVLEVHRMATGFAAPEPFGRSARVNTVFVIRETSMPVNFHEEGAE